MNLKAELEVRRLNEKMDHLFAHQWQRLMEVQQIQMDMMAVLIDDDGTQYEAIPYDTFKLRFPDVEYYPQNYPYYWGDNYPLYNFEGYNNDKPSYELNVKLAADSDERKSNENRRQPEAGQVREGNQNRERAEEGKENRDRDREEGYQRDGDRTYFYYGNRYDYCYDWGDCYWDWQRNLPRSYYRYQSSAYYKKAIAQRTLFASTNLYPDGAKSGFLAFPLLVPEADNLKLIIPVTVNENGQSQIIRFQFQFQKTPATPSEKTK